MEKRNQKQSDLSPLTTYSRTQVNKSKHAQATGKKCLAHQKILTEDVFYTKSISPSASIPKQRFSRSQHQKKAQRQKMTTAAHTWSTWSIQNNKGLVTQMTKINEQMKAQNERIKNFLKQIKPQLDCKLGCTQSNTLTRVSLSQKIKNQCLMLHHLSCTPFIK